MFDYLAIGTITQDVTPQGMTMGGTVAYSGRVAQALGCRTAVVTSAGADYDLVGALPDIAVAKVVAEYTSTFANIYAEGGRKQILYARSNDIGVADVPAGWEKTPIVHLGPLVDDLDPQAMIAHCRDSLIGLTPQGWLRQWDEDGHITPSRWAEAEAVLPLADAVVLSDEDLLDEAMLGQYRQWAKLLVMTEGPGGCTVFKGDEIRRFPAPDVVVSDLTGAGDTFAAAFFMRLYQTQGDAWQAAEFANYVASEAVTQPDLATKIGHLQGLSHKVLGHG